MQDEHNKLRQQVTQAKLDKKQYGDLQGTNSMFAVTYDCTNDALANALITSDCKRSDVNVALMGRSANFHETRVRLDESNVQQLEDEFQFAFEEWRDSVSKPLNKDVVYNDVSIAPFANMIYYKTASLGCAYTYCKDKKKIAIACVYGDE
ncbi:SCP-like protein [Ancylostoma caninum]|uniref:SCP-like protein n=1 Tax=Ancylostoma caninum TaxID=29170 RepID=A0A368GSE9_ANCCA|nr:SCP-like protein [Ancylostoma caninum]